MKFVLPDAATLKEIGDQLGFRMENEYVEQVRTFMAPFGEAFTAMDELPDELPTVKYPRGPWRKPTTEENTRGAWYVKVQINGARGGPLAGKTVALKDMVCLANAPMMNGSSISLLAAMWPAR